MVVRAPAPAAPRFVSAVRTAVSARRGAATERSVLWPRGKGGRQPPTGAFWEEVREGRIKRRELARDVYLEKNKAREAARPDRRERALRKEEPDLSPVSGASPDLAADEGSEIRELTPAVASSEFRPPFPREPSVGCSELLECKSPGALLHRTEAATLALAAGDTSRLDEVALAAQLFGQWSGGWQRARVCRDKRYENLLDTLVLHGKDLDSEQLVGALWGVVRVGKPHTCAEEFLALCGVHLPQMSAEQAAVVMQCMVSSQALSISKVALGLQDELLAVLRVRINQLEPNTAAGVLVSCARMKVADRDLFTALAEHVGKSGSQVHVSDMAAASASLARLRVTNMRLRLSAQSCVKRQVHLCTPRSIVQFCSSLSESEDIEVFRDYIAPTVRSFVNDFSSRDLCTIAESFLKVRVSDSDFLSDLGHSLHAKVSDMDAHDISVALTVFKPISYAVPTLFSSMAGRARDIIGDFSPRQLSRTFRGLAASQCRDEVLISSLRTRVVDLSRVLYGTNATDVLVALSETGGLTSEALTALLYAIGRSLDSMPARDYIAVLHVVGGLPPSLQDVVPGDFADDVLQALHQRGRHDWRSELDDVTHLLEAMAKLGKEDEVLLELVCRHLPRALKRSDCSLEALLRLMTALADLPPRSHTQIRTHLHRRPRLQGAFWHCLTAQIAKNLDAASAVEVAFACASLGYENQYTQSWLDRVVSTIDASEVPLTSEVTCRLCWALAELSWQIDWARATAIAFANHRYGTGAMLDSSAGLEGADHGDKDFDRGSLEAPHQLAHADPVSADSLLRLAWALTVFNEEVPVPLLVELHAAFDGFIPCDAGGTGLRFLQVIELQREIARRSANDSTPPLPQDVAEWLSLALEVPRTDLHTTVSPRARRLKQKLSAKVYPYEHWLSAALAQLHLPHKTGHVIAAYRVGASFPRQKHLIDVTGLHDLSAPAGRVLGGAELRSRQLMQLGWVVHSVKLRDLYDATRGGTLRLLVSKMLSSFDPNAARSGSFQSSVIKEKRGALNVHTKRQSPLNESGQEFDLMEDESDDDSPSDRASDPVIKVKGPKGKLFAQTLTALDTIRSKPHANKDG